MNKVIDYVVQNGFMKNISALLKAPFDKPQIFVKLFHSETQKIIILMGSIKENERRL